MIAANAFGMPASGWLNPLAGSAMRGDKARSCAVWLIDRRTGATHRVNGRPLVVFTRQPDQTIAEMMEGRDPTVWDTRVEAVGWEGAR